MQRRPTTKVRKMIFKGWKVCISWCIQASSTWSVRSAYVCQGREGLERCFPQGVWGKDADFFLAWKSRHFLEGLRRSELETNSENAPLLYYFVKVMSSQLTNRTSAKKCSKKYRNRWSCLFFILHQYSYIDKSVLSKGHYDMGTAAQIGFSRPWRWRESNPVSVSHITHETILIPTFTASSPLAQGWADDRVFLIAYIDFVKPATKRYCMAPDAAGYSSSGASHRLARLAMFENCILIFCLPAWERPFSIVLKKLSVTSEFIIVSWKFNKIKYLTNPEAISLWHHPMIDWASSPVVLRELHGSGWSFMAVDMYRDGTPLSSPSSPLEKSR